MRNVEGPALESAVLILRFQAVFDEMPITGSLLFCRNRMKIRSFL